MANRPLVKVGDWIRVGAIDALVMFVGNDCISVGYHQNRVKALKDDVIWNGEKWEFKYSGPSGSYLRGSEEASVKRGPVR